MTRKGDTVLAATLKRYGKKIQKYIQDCIAKPLIVKVLIEDARDSAQKTSGVISIEIEVENPEGWGGDNIIEIHGNVGLEKAGKRGKKEDEAYLDGVTVGDWDKGSKAIGLNGCSVGEFLTHMFTLFAIKAGNESVLLDNAAGPRGEHIYKQVGFIKSKGDRAAYGDDNEMIFPLTGKKKNKDAGQLWRERYNKFRKKLQTKIKNSANCKTFWKCVPPALEAPGPVHMLARGSKRKTRKKRGSNGKDNKCVGKKKDFGVCMKALDDKKKFNKAVIGAQDTSLGQFKTDDPTILMGFPSGKGGGRRKMRGSRKKRGVKRKTRKKRGGDLEPGARVKLNRNFRSFKKDMVAYIVEVDEEESDTVTDPLPKIYYTVDFVKPAGWDNAIGLRRRWPAEWFESFTAAEQAAEAAQAGEQGGGGRFLSKSKKRKTKRHY